MKTLELDLKKKVLIVDLPERYEFTAIGNDKEIYYAIKLDENYTKISNGKEWKFICKGSELTEEIASGLVNSDDDYGVVMYQNYRTTSMSYFDEQITALESFISMIESKGFYWMENPIEKPHNIGLLDLYPTGDILMDKSLECAKKWQEAEEKTLRNPLIFVKK